jgi:cytochrome P450
VGRAALRTLRLDDWRIPAGTFLVPSIHLVHRRPDIYPEPEQFRPDRFLNVKPAPYAFIPFGGGPRRCLGASFAHVEMRVAIRAILRQTELRPMRQRAEQPVRVGPSVGPRTGTRVISRRR